MFSGLTIAFLTVFSLIVLISISVNIIQIMVMRKMNPRLQVVDIPTYNVSIVCVVCASLSYPCVIIRFGYGMEVVPNSLCPLMMLIPAFTAIMINFAFLILAIERYLSVVYPLFHRRLTTKSFKSVIYSKWIGTSFCLLLIVTSTHEPNGCQGNTIVRTIVVTNVAASLIATISLYIKLFKAIRLRITVKGNTAHHRSKLNHSYITFTMYVTFATLWVPANVAMPLANVVFPDVNLLHKFGIPAILASLTFMTNTVISLQKCPEFRKQFLSFFRPQKDPAQTVPEINIISPANFASSTVHGLS